MLRPPQHETRPLAVLRMWSRRDIPVHMVASNRSLAR
jgi:hypothetical protein